MSADQPIMGQLHCTCPEEALMTVSCDGSCHAYAASRAESIRWETSQAQTGSANRIRWIRISETFSFLNWAKLRYAAMPSYSKLCQAMPSCLESGCGIKELLCSQLGISREPVESGKINGALATP